MSEQREGQCVCEGDLRKGLWQHVGNIIHEATNKASRKSLRNLNRLVLGLFFSGEVQLNSGRGYKKWELLKIPWETKQWQIDFLGVVLGTDPNDSKRGGACLVSGGASSFFQKTPGLPPGLRVRGASQRPSGIPRMCGQGWAHGQSPAKEAAVCQCYFKQASLAGAVILSLS